MIDWNQQDVEQFLGLSAVCRESTSPLGTHSEVIFDLPFPNDPVRFCISPALDHCQFYTDDDASELVSAYVHTVKISVNDEPEEEGGMCIVLQGNGGHVCISPSKPYYRLFFSMYGDKTSLPSRNAD